MLNFPLGSIQCSMELFYHNILKRFISQASINMPKMCSIIHQRGICYGLLMYGFVKMERLIKLSQFMHSL